MLKKYCKLWLFMLIMSLLVCIPVSAKEMTVEEIGELIDVKGDNTINTARIVGGYVFTNASGVPFEIYDIMLASRTINVPTGDKADRTKMVIYEINRVWDEDDNPTWEVNSKNFVGEGTIAKSEKIDIKYIDYEKVKEDAVPSTFEINLYSGEYLGFKGNHSSLQMIDGVLNGLIVKDTEISADIRKTNYYFAYTINVENATDDVTIKVGDTTYHKSDLSGNSITLLQPVSNADTKKELEIIVDLDGNGEKYSEAKKTINWGIVTYQHETSGVTVSEKIPSEDIETFKKAPYGYDNSNDTYKITCEGVNCTISGDIYKQTVHDDAFGSANKEGWFILLNIALDGVSNKTIFTVPDNGGYKNIKGVEGESLSLLYKLKDTGGKTFTITVDLDGDEDNYLPVTYTFNYESAVLKGTFVIDSSKTKVTIPNDSDVDGDGYISNDDKNTLASWGFDFNKLGNVVISDGDSTYAYKLTGSVKEQEVNAGFASNKGFYVPLKIYFASENYQDYFDKWVVYVKGENGEFIKRVPSGDDYEKGFITVLYKVYEEGHPITKNKEIEYKIDFDGDGEKFNPITLKINYQDLEFIHEHTVTFMSKGQTIETQKVYTNEKIKDVTSEAINNIPYHTFKNWETCSDNVCSVFDGTVTSDVTLYAQYEVDFDSFVTDLINNQDTNEDEDDNFVLTKDDKTINFDILKANVSISELENINLFKAMAESLKTGEIKKLKVTSGEEKVEFTNESSESIASSVINLIKSKNESATNLEDIPADFSFSIIILEHDPLITYKDTDTTYEFKFVNNIDFANLSVTSKELLNSALASNSPVINIGGSFTVDSLTDNLKEIKRDVVINGHGNTITYTGSDNYIFNITNGNVVIDDLKIVVERENKENIDAIKISNEANVTLNKVTMPDTKGIVVDNAHVAVSNMTFSTESYDNPLIRSTKEVTRLTNVVLNRGNNKFASEKIYEENVTYEDSNKEFFGDTLREKEGYNYRHYYLNGDNENKWIKIGYHADRSITGFAGVFVRYYDKTSGSVPLPPVDSMLMTYKDDNNTYKTTKWCNSYERNECFDANSLKPTADIEYWPQIETTPRSDKTTANDESELLEALQNESYKVIYINSDIELNSPLNITRSVKLIGYEGSGSHANKLSNAKTITGQIIINADGVIFTNLKVVGKGTKNGARLDVITVNKTKFVLSNVMVSASEGTWDSAVYYTVDNPDTYIGDFSTFVGDNLKSFVEFMGSVDSGTDILNITFKGKKSSDTVTVTPTSHIIIHKLSEGANIILRQIHFQFENATDYALKLYGLAEATNNGSIQIYSNYFTGSNGDKFRIGIETDATNKNASSYNINPTEKANSSLEVKYINDGEEQDHNTFGTEATVEVK